MNTPDTREITEVKTSRTGLGRKTARQPRTNGNGSAPPGSPRMILRSGAPGLAPESVPDCDDDGPIGLAARKRGDVGRSHYADPPATDPNSSLIDELERILRGDFADEDDVSADDRRPRYPSFGADPLSLLDPDPEDTEDDDIVANFAAPFEQTVGRAEPQAERIAPSTGRSPLRPAAGVRSPVVFGDGDRDDFGYFDEGPPRTADFWHAEAQPAAFERHARGRPRRGLSRGYLTVSGLLLLVAAGGIYSTMQFRGNPGGGTLPDQTGVAAADALGDVAADEPRLVNVTVETPPPMAGMGGTPEGAVVAATPAEGADPAVDAAAEPPAAAAVEAEPEPRIVPLFRSPDEGAPAAADDPAGAAAEAGAEDPAANPAREANAVAMAAPAGAAAPTPPAAIAGTPPAAAGAATRQATITDWVNLRADNSMNARVILVIPLGASVELIGCPGWCEVIYDGTRGFVGPDFVDPL